MKPVRLILAATGIGMAAACIVGCNLIPARPAGTRFIALPAAPPSVLGIIVDPAAPGAAAQVGSLIRTDGRPAMHVYVIDLVSGAVLEAAAGPRVNRMRIADPPVLPPHPTTFQKRDYEKAKASYRAAVRADLAGLRRQQARELDVLAAGAQKAVTAVRPGRQVIGGNSLNRALNVAAAQVASLLSAGVGVDAHKVVAVLGPGASSPADPPDLPTALQGSVVVVAGFTGSSEAAAAWQASLRQQHARRVVTLTPATESQLPAVVREGLDGAISVTLTRVLFGPAGYRLRPAAGLALQHLLWLLTTRYPNAAAVIDGYTDNLPVKGGNLLLSKRRAEAVEAWLIKNKIAPQRLQAFGYGAAFPVAPNHPAGQPLNRRVVVIIDPVG